jgi:CheY-like chemotaxis protein
VLLVEDNATNRKVVDLILSPLGVKLTTAENGALGVETWRSGVFDLVLMDMQMPVMDGLSAIRLIRAEEAPDRRIPIAVLSANAMADHRRQALEAGADLHIAKPVTPAALLAGIELVLGQDRKAA